MTYGDYERDECEDEASPVDEPQGEQPVQDANRWLIPYDFKRARDVYADAIVDCFYWRLRVGEARCVINFAGFGSAHYRGAIAEAIELSQRDNPMGWTPDQIEEIMKNGKRMRTGGKVDIDEFWARVDPRVWPETEYR